jgi:hypothetical protein
MMTRQQWADEDVPVPRPVWARVACDGDHGLLPRPEVVLDVTPPRPGSWAQANALGWSITAERDLCPRCCGKRPKTEE